MKEKIIIFGAGKMGELAYFYFTKDSPYEVIAFTADKDYMHSNEFLGLPLVLFDNIERQYDPTKFKMFVAVGYAKLNSIRKEKYFEAKKKGYELVSYLSSKAIHWGDIKIGDNCFILENQVIQSNVKIGNNVVLWSGNHFGHDVLISDHCWVSSHVVLSGNVKLGERSFVGVNATIREKVRIGRDCIIGAGAIILNNVADKSVYVAQATEKYPIDSDNFIKMMSFALGDED